MTLFDQRSDEAKLAWAAGLFEGEGSITPFGRVRKDGSRLWRLCMGSTDLDVLHRLQAVFGGRLFGPFVRTNRASHKPMWTWALYPQAEVEETLARMVPFLCERRAERAHEALEAMRVWRSKQS